MLPRYFSPFLSAYVLVTLLCSVLLPSADGSIEHSLAIGDLAAGALISGVGSLVSGMFGASSQSDANRANLQIARENREWQTKENQLNRDWQEKMWNAENAYNTPSAMRARLQEAGYNPQALFGEKIGNTAGSAGSPSMVGSPGAPTMQPVNPMSGLGSIGDSVGLYLQAKSVDANAANQRSQAESNIISSLAQAYKELGKDGFQKFAERIAPFMKSVNPDDSYWSKKMKSEIYNLDMDSLNKELSYELSDRFSAQQIETGIQEANYRISEIVGRLNSMRVENQALIDRTAAEVVRASADAFRLRKEGEKYVADKKTVDALRKFVVGSAEATMMRDQIGAGSDARSFIMSTPKYNYWTSEEGKRASFGEESITGEQRSSQLIRAMDKVFGEYFNVGFNKYSYEGRNVVDHVPHNSKSASFNTTTPWGTRQQNTYIRYE